MFWKIAASIIFCSGLCFGDSIIIGGVKFYDVVVRDSTSQYYVQIPTSGKTLNVPKSNIKPEDVTIESNATEREKLVKMWKEKNDSLPKNPTQTPLKTEVSDNQLSPEDKELLKKYSSSEEEKSNGDSFVFIDGNGVRHAQKKTNYVEVEHFNHNIPSMIEKKKKADEAAAEAEYRLKQQELQIKAAEVQNIKRMAAATEQLNRQQIQNRRPYTSDDARVPDYLRVNTQTSTYSSQNSLHQQEALQAQQDTAKSLNRIANSLNR